MRKVRFYHSVRLILARSAVRRAKYLKEHHLLGGIGKNCRWGPAILPLYANMIRLHDNVTIHKTAHLYPHDMINRFLAAAEPDKDFGGRERLGCIEIMDNVYVSMYAIILPNVRINRNCIISAGSVVTGDVPENSIVAGNPARVVGRFDTYVASRLLHRDVPFKNQEIPDELVARAWEEFENTRKQQSAAAADDAHPANAAVEAKIIDLLSRNVSGVDFARETRLIDNRVFDSLSLLTVVALLEDAFDCKIPFHKINGENFNSARGMARMIAGLSGDAAVRAQAAAPAAPREAPEPLALDVKETEKPVVRRILENALENPEDAAIIANDTVTTFRRLAGKIVSIARWLADRGVGRGDCVTVQAVHDASCVACYYAIHLLGAILVPVENKAAGDRILEIAEQTRSALIVSLQARSADIPWADYAAVKAVEGNIAYDADTAVDWPDLDLPCEMIFTTGTTGKSKGVLMTHRHMSWYAYSVAKCIQMKRRNRFLLTTPLNHAGGLRRTHLSLANGCCMVYMDGLNDLAKYFDYIERYRVTSLYLPPVAIRILVTRTGDELRKYSDRIDFVYSSSSPLPEADCANLRALLPHTRLYNAYEASETPGVSAYDYNTDDARRGCLGPANAGVELAILREDGVITRDPDVQGQICVKSRMNMKEYYLESELTSSVMREGWFVSSDLGRLDAEGNLYYDGRKGDVINIGGYKIAPTDVEEAALASGLIGECICVEALDQIGVPFVKLLVVPLQGKPLDAAALNRFLTARLEAYKVPRVIEQVEAIQKTFNGKLDRKAYR